MVNRVDYFRLLFYLLVFGNPILPYTTNSIFIRNRHSFLHMFENSIFLSNYNAPLKFLTDAKFTIPRASLILL